jgi:hypothetical protein
MHADRMSQLRRIVISVVVMSVVPACGDDGGQPETDAPTADAPPGTPDAPVPDAAPPDAHTGLMCGGKTGVTCPSTQYCDFLENGCGATDEFGFCTDKPIGCPDSADPDDPDLVFEATCGCDGVIYGSACEAYVAGSDLNRYGGCPVPVEDFACGWLQCSRLNEYCQHTISDVEGESDGYQCLPIPPCPTQWPTCACLATEPCGTACTGDFDSGLTLTCPGG